MKYFHSEITHNTTAPKIILPIVMDLVHPKSVLDVGCGIGTWLAVCKNMGIQDVLGIDGNYVEKALLHKYLTENEFLAYDLNTEISLERKFDLILCLEVAEHLEKNSSKIFVNNLVNHGDVILFSAAIPGQGGQNHLNEQWPEYWEKLFLEVGYSFVDCIRPIIWDSKEIEFWYKQNIFLVVKKCLTFPTLNSKPELSKIHPELIELKNQQLIKLEKRLSKVLNVEESLKFYVSLLKKKILKRITQ